jgi:hypothetical protein
MGGDLEQWTETAVNNSTRALRGGYWAWYSGYLASSSRGYSGPTAEGNGVIGFRVANVPEPSAIALLLTSAAGLFAYAYCSSFRQRPGFRGCRREAVRTSVPA